MSNWKQIAKELLPEEFEKFQKFTGGGRRPDSVKFTTIEGDVKRRDLTINALFYDIDTQEVIDLVGGIHDLEKGIVRAVGKASDRFAEDKLRVLRAIRFAARFGSQLDAEIVEAIRADNSMISADGNAVSGERVKDEFFKGIKTAKHVLHFLDMIAQLDLQRWIFGDLETSGFMPVEMSNDPIVVTAAVLRDNSPEDIRKGLNKLKHSGNDCRDISFLVSLQSLTAEKAVALKKKQFIIIKVDGEKVKNPIVSDDQIREFSKFTQLSDDLVEAFIKFELSVTAEDALGAGVEKGPVMGEFIKNKEIEIFESMI